MTKSIAWLLNIDPHHQVAVGLHDVLHIIAEPTVYQVPQTPFYCHDLLVWQNQYLPIINLAAWRDNQAVELPKKYALIVRYNCDNEIKQGVLWLSSPPQRIEVDNSQACQLPNTPALWKQLADSCFLFEQKEIPVLNLNTLFELSPQ